MRFLPRADTRKSSTLSSLIAATNCCGPGSSEQFSPNCWCTKSSVTAGEGDLACAGGGGGSFFDCALSEAVPAAINNNATENRRNSNRENNMTITVVPFIAAD